MGIIIKMIIKVKNNIDNENRMRIKGEIKCKRK